MPEPEMNGDEAAQSVARDAVEGQEPGSQAVAQTEGQTMNPHSSASGENHVDGWSATVEDDGSVSTAKEHSD